MNAVQIKEVLNSASFQQKLKSMYGAERVTESLARYESAVSHFESEFGHKEFEFFTSPGRTEIGGNHTDHNQGTIIAGSVQMDCVAVAAKNNSNLIHIVSEGFSKKVVIDIDHLEFTGEKTGSYTLVKGVLAGLQKKGFTISGFDAYVTSSVLVGSGVSSSASFEMLICTMVDYFFNDYTRDVVTYAKAGQYAENNYWLKGSGLLDQMSCAVGGIITIDFADVENPSLRRVDCDFDALGLDLVIVNTGKGHSDLSAEYSAIPDEMKSVASFLDCDVLAQTTEQAVIEHAVAIRKACGDRAFLRAIHFFEESRRAVEMVTALEAKDRDRFLKEVIASGNSSFKWLQNCYLNEKPEEQHISCALALTELFLAKLPYGASRVHGGGFAGVIAVFVPKEETEHYCEYINKTLGAKSAFKMHIRQEGAIHLEL